MPWPKYPCCSCRCANHHGPRAPYEDFCEASGYFWHTAMWNPLKTAIRDMRGRIVLKPGAWKAVCCEGHRLRGKAHA